MKFYTIDQISELLQLHRTKITREIKEGKLKAINVGQPTKPTYRIAEEDLQRWLEERKGGMTNE